MVVERAHMISQNRKIARARCDLRLRRLAAAGLASGFASSHFEKDRLVRCGKLSDSIETDRVTAGGRDVISA